MADMFVLLFGCVLILVIRFVRRPILDRRAEARFRQNSLRFDAQTGLYHWTTRNGAQHSSDRHPAKPGGAWHEAELEAVSHLRP